MGKTYGEILRETREAWELNYTETGLYDPDWRVKCDEDVAQAVRSKVIEDCIQELSKPLTVAASHDVIIALEDLRELHIEALRINPMGKTKTIGQLSYEVGQDATNEMLGGILDLIPWEDIGPELQEIHQATVSAVRKAVLTEAIEALSGEVKGCTLGYELAGKITESQALSLLNNQRKIDIAALQRLIGETSIGVVPRPIWTPEQVANLHAHQHSLMCHPFTCPERHDHPIIDGDKGILIPTVRGWICQFCDYTQDWAHESMLEGRIPQNPFEEPCKGDEVEAAGSESLHDTNNRETE